MKVIIKENSEVQALSIINPESGIDYILNFLGHQGALLDGQFEWSEELDAHVCDQETFDWWYEVVTANQSLEDRIFVLVKEHGSQAVYEVIHDSSNADLKSHVEKVNQALDEAFGCEEKL